VKKDAAIKLTISTGKPKVPVPDVHGKSVAEAASVLGQAGLNGSKTQSEASDTVPKDQVIRTDPAAGTQVEKGSSVTIIVSSGPAQVSVPDVSSGGISKSAAENTITNAGLVPQGHCTGVNPGQSNATQVNSQTPSPNTKVDKGSKVDFNFTAKDASDCL
jgi:serine/threonine-protein kinase